MIFSPYQVYDSSGKHIGTVSSKKAAQFMARAAGGEVRKGGKVVWSGKSNPKKKRAAQKRNAGGKLRFVGGGKYGLKQKHAAYRGHTIWQDRGFGGAISYTVDNSTTRYKTPAEAKRYVDGLSGARNAGPYSKRKTKKVRGKGGGDFGSVMKSRSKATKAARKAKKKGNPHHLEGWTAIRYAEKHDLYLNKYADPTEGARHGLTPSEAEAVAMEDPRLIWLNVPSGKKKTKNPPKKNPRRARPILLKSSNPFGGIADLPLNQTVKTTINKIPVQVRRTQKSITITRR